MSSSGNYILKPFHRKSRSVLDGSQMQKAKPGMPTILNSDSKIASLMQSPKNAKTPNMIERRLIQALPSPKASVHKRSSSLLSTLTSKLKRLESSEIDFTGPLKALEFDTNVRENQVAEKEIAKHLGTASLLSTD